MASFAAKKDEEDDKSAEDVLGIVKTGPKKLTTAESSSIFNLKNEFLKRKDRLGGMIKPTGSHVVGKSNLLSTSKPEKDRLAQESKDRNARISNLEKELKLEEDKKYSESQKKLREKAELYDRMADGKVVLANRDDTPVDFLVDFSAIKRRKDEEKAAERARYKDEEEAAPVGFGRAPVPEHYHHSEEQRVYGTSHMRLSLNENKRKEEIEQLLEFSKKTDADRAKKQEDERKKNESRREKINRMRTKHGLEPLPEPKPEEPAEPVDLDAIPMPGQKETPEERHARLMKSDREWDRGKGHYTTWIEKQRDERDDEFRPPDSYFH